MRQKTDEFRDCIFEVSDLILISCVRQRQTSLISLSHFHVVPNVSYKSTSPDALVSKMRIGMVII